MADDYYENDASPFAVQAEKERIEKIDWDDPVFEGFQKSLQRDQETEDSLTADTERQGDDFEYYDEDDVERQKEEEAEAYQDDYLADRDRFDFENELKERMLQSELIEEIDVSNVLLSQRGEGKMTETELQDVENGMKEWSQEYDQCIANPPKDGDILTTLEADSKVLLAVELKAGAAPFIYARAYVPEIVGQALGWFLASDSQTFHGWKCILLPRARTELIRKFGLQKETMEVESLRVIRPSQSGKSLLCEVHEYGDKENVVETETAALADTPDPVLEDEVPAKVPAEVASDEVPFIEGAQDTSEVMTPGPTLKDEGIKENAVVEEAIHEVASNELL